MTTASQFKEIYPHLSWNYTCSQILELQEQTIKNTTECMDKLVNLPDEKIFPDSVIELMAFDETSFKINHNILLLLAYIDSNDKVRNEAAIMSQKLSNFLKESKKSKAAFKILQKIRFKIDNSNYDAKRYVETKMQEFMDNGVNLSKSQRIELNAISLTKENLCLEGYNYPWKTLKLKIEELAGMSKDFIDSLEKENDRYIVTPKYKIYMEILKYCSIIETRKKVDDVWNEMNIKKNVELFETLIAMKHRQATLHHYSTYKEFLKGMSCYRLDPSKEILSSIYEKIKEPAQKEMDRLLELKKQDCIMYKCQFDGKINSYDVFYYQTLAEELDFFVDHNFVDEHFPMELVIEQLFQICETLFSLKFVKVEGVPVWHEKVSVYAVTCSLTYDILGHFYLDLFCSSLNKNSASFMPIQPACFTKEGFILSCGALLVNFDIMRYDNNLYLSFAQVQMYFSKFGHMIHYICYRNLYSTFIETPAMKEFSELTSIIVENLVFEADFLKKTTRHYLTKQPLSDDIISSMIKWRSANISLDILRQIALSVFDQSIHLSLNVKVLTKFSEIWQKILGYTPCFEKHFINDFAALRESFDCKFYMFLWLRIMAIDLYVSFLKKGNSFDSDMGFKYRQAISRSRVACLDMHLFQDIFNRKPNQETFLYYFGILHKP